MRTSILRQPKLKVRYSGGKDAKQSTLAHRNLRGHGWYLFFELSLGMSVLRMNGATEACIPFGAAA